MAITGKYILDFLFLLTLTSVSTRGQSVTKILLYVGNTQLTNYGHYTCGSGTQLTCHYANDKVYGEYVSLKKYGGENLNIKHLSANEPTIKQVMSGTISSSGEYGCLYLSYPNIAVNVTITISGSDHICRNTDPTSPPTTPHTNPTTSSPNTPHTTSSGTGSHTSSSSSTSTTGSTHTAHFTGLNPIIYTMIVAVLLGILALVAIITCWLRSRKNARMNTLLPRDSPQDYLDYIREGQFTPLTTSEFLASLHERPPTYNESQDIERRLKEDEESPPPSLPPRNPNMTRPLTVITGEPLGNLSFTDVQVEHTRPQNREMSDIEDFPQTTDDTTNLLQNLIFFDEDSSENIITHSPGVTPSLSAVV